MSQKYDCPSCGGAVTFQSSIAVFAVCPYCRSMVVRHDVNVEAIGTMAELPPDLSPLRIGATGEYEGKGFTLLGRVRVAYEEGSWTEWYALFGNETYGWIAEAQGAFTVGFEMPKPPAFPAKPDALHAKTRLTIGDGAYTVSDRKQTKCLWGEGELPFVAKPGREATNIDMTSPGGRFAGAEFSEDGVRLFAGRYVRFEELKFAGLRAVPGWSSEAEITRNKTGALNCPECGSVIELRAAGFAMSATCRSCGSLIDTATPNLRLITRAVAKQTVQPKIPLGQRGELWGVTYELIGFQHVKDKYTGWFEYLLFNPWEGFCWLVNYQGHWSFVTRLFEEPTPNGSSGAATTATLEGKTYQIFDTSEVTTDYVVGEFYWKVAVGMRVRVRDFIRPPDILSCESYDQLDEVTWSWGEYVEPEVIQKAFKLPEPLREPVGIYLNQPNPYLEKARQLPWLLPLLLLILFAVHLASISRTANRQVLREDYTFQAGGTNGVFVTEPFELGGASRQAVEITLAASVNNNWMEIDVSLVNTNTQQKEATFEQGIEFYSGYDGGYWTEGKQRETVTLPAIPPGEYYLTADVSADPAVREMPFTITVVRDVPIWSNFWIAFVIILAYPAYRWIRGAMFEQARWSESDYAP